jgi:hypothetical protein
MLRLGATRTGQSDTAAVRGSRKKRVFWIIVFTELPLKLAHGADENTGDLN